MRYTSDFSDAEWSLIHYCYPKPCKTGRPRKQFFWELLNAIFYLAKTACQWRNSIRPQFDDKTQTMNLRTFRFVAFADDALGTLLTGSGRPACATL